MRVFEELLGKVQYVLTDPVEVGRWLDCKHRQYGDIKSLKALHGADYQKQAKDTTEMHTRVCEAIFLDRDFEYIRSDVLFNLFKNNGGANKNISFHRLVGAWLEQHPELGISYSGDVPWPWKDSAHDNRTTARVYIKEANRHAGLDGKRHRLQSNDHAYGVEEQVGRWRFWVDVI